MRIKLCKNVSTNIRKGKYIDKDVAKQLTDIAIGKKAFREEKYAKAMQYLEKKAMLPNATDGIKFMVGASYTEIKIHEKEAAELLKSIIQKYKDEPKEKRTLIYSGAILEYAKIQLRNELTEFAIYLLEDVTTKNEKYNLYKLNELAKAYDMLAQNYRAKDKEDDALEAEKKAQAACLKCKELSKNKLDLKLKKEEARNLLGILYIRQGKILEAKQEFEELKNINSENNKELFEMTWINLLKKAYFKEESEEEVNKRIDRLEKKMEAIENGEQEEKKEYARELNLVSRIEFYEELSPELKIFNGKDIFTGYKMYEYPSRGICVIDKVFDEIKDQKKIIGYTYVFSENTIFDLEKLSRTEIMKTMEIESNIQKQQHKGDYYNLIQEKMKRAELEGLVIEEKNLKAKEKEIEKKEEINKNEETNGGDKEKNQDETNQ